MARTVGSTNKVKKDTVEIIDEVKDVIEKDNEKEELKAQNMQMSEMLKEMQEEIKMMKNKIGQQNEPQTVVVQQNNDIYKSILVTSLVPQMLNLKTEPTGKRTASKSYTFTKYGQTIPIPFLEMQKVISICISFFEDGKAVLSSKEDYESLGIGYLYESVMKKDKIDEIVKLKKDEDIDIILRMSDDMQEAVARQIANNVESGVISDYNKIKKLKDSGIDIEKIIDANKKEDE